MIAALLDLAEARSDRPTLLNAMRGQGMILLFMGHLADAREVIERAFEAFEASNEADRLAARAAGQDAGVADLALMSWALWLLGHARYGSHTNGCRHSTCRRHRSSAFAGLCLLLCVHSPRSSRRAGLRTAMRNAVSPYRRSTDSGNGEACRAPSGASARPC